MEEASQPPVGGSMSIVVEGVGDYRTVVKGVTEKQILIDVPLHPKTRAPLAVQAGDSLRVQYLAVDNEVYRCSIQVLGISYVPFPRLRVSNPALADDAERVQRREFYRIALDTDVRVIGSNRTMVMGSAIDISGGGLAVKFKQDPGYQPRESVRVQFDLPEVSYHVDVKCIIIRVENAGMGKWETSMMFDSIPDKDRQQIVRYTFLRQRAMKKST